MSDCNITIRWLARLLTSEVNRTELLTELNEELQQQVKDYKECNKSLEEEVIRLKEELELQRVYYQPMDCDVPPPVCVNLPAYVKPDEDPKVINIPPLPLDPNIIQCDHQRRGNV